MSTITRVMYYSKLRDAEAADAVATWAAGASAASHWTRSGLRDVALFALGAHVCLYAEAVGASDAAAPARSWDWPAEIAELFEHWPQTDSVAARSAVPMLDVFHDGVPTDAESWRGDREVADRIGSLTFLKPEMFASYVFHHFQLQEERPETLNKTYMIGSLGTLLFSYSESPAVAVNAGAPARADDRTPVDWHGAMEPHFDPTRRPPGEAIWQRMRRLG
ncbi:hypothetical protein [Agromyces sp. NPDC056965]|uniref:hypothetical protein n=1 Tax=Agromyces sp. NPDC056965 TaxID=3345983 RepID=UPI00362764AB